MLYASSRGYLMKSLGAAHFSDNIFATSKSDVSAESYLAHRRHIEAPKPQTSKEKEMELVREAERGGSYEGSRGRRNHVGARVGLGWSEGAESAIRELGSGEEDTLVLMVRNFLLCWTISFKDSRCSNISFIRPSTWRRRLW